MLIAYCSLQTLGTGNTKPLLQHNIHTDLDFGLFWIRGVGDFLFKANWTGNLEEFEKEGTRRKRERSYLHPFSCFANDNKRHARFSKTTAGVKSGACHQNCQYCRTRTHIGRRRCSQKTQEKAVGNETKEARDPSIFTHRFFNHPFHYKWRQSSIDESSI